MRRIFYTITGIMLLLMSCAEEFPNESGSSQSGKGIDMYLTVPERQEIRSRSDVVPADKSIDNHSIYVLIFEGNETSSKLLDFGLATSAQNASVISYHIKLAEQESPCYAYIIANAKSIIDTQSAGWEKNSTTLGEISAAMQTATLATTDDVVTAMPDTHPMTGSCSLQGVSANTSIGSASSPIALIPATVKVTVENRVPAGSGYTFQLQGANLGNAPEKGFIMPGQDSQGIEPRNYGKEGDQSSMIAGIESIEGVQTTQPLYGYESVADNETFVILKATYNGGDGYYKLGFYTDADKTNSRALLRGMHYKITVRQVLTAGFRTVDEAIVSPASNGIVYDINVDDGDSHDIITNGVQYLGVSNSEYIAYHSNYVNEFELYYVDGVNNAPNDKNYPLTPFTATILTYTADPSWSKGIVTASEGITLVDDALNKVQSLTLLLPATEGGAVRKELKIFMSNEFKSGNLDIRIGNLHKIIKIKRELSFTVMGGAVSLGRDISYISARTLPDPMADTPSTGDPKTYSIANSEKGTALLTGDGTLNTEPGQELFLQIQNRFTWEDVNYCYGELYLHHNTSAGRTKVSFAVEMRGTEPWGDYSYTTKLAAVNAFWKNDEKGERLVQLLQLPREIPGLMFPYFGRWQARVLVGEDFIRLGEWDESITVTDHHFDGDPESRPVNDGKLMLVGKENIIRFRIGLTSTNEGHSNRYGLVQLLYIDKRHNNDPKNQIKLSCLIFVRQGEEADNVLTPGKSYTNYGAEGTFIAPDVKFSPYPLVDPTLGEGGPDINNHTEITDANKPIFAPYPSYIDYLYQWSGDRFFHPKNPEDAITNWNEGYSPSEFKELCPEGYITPPSQINGSNVYNGLRTAFPLTYGNAVAGHCLDGYQDRYLQFERDDIDLSLVNYSPYTPKSLEGGTGLLIFNPETMASTFLSGMLFYRASWEGSLCSERRAGWSYFWTKDQDQEDASSAHAIFYYGLNDFSFDTPFIKSFPKSTAMPIRCIKDPAKK